MNPSNHPFYPLSAAALLVALTTLTGCPSDDDTTAGPPAGSAGQSSAGAGQGGAPGAGQGGAGGASAGQGGAGQSGAAGGVASAEEEYSARATGVWLLQFTVPNPAGNVYVNDTETIYGPSSRFTLFVEVFLTEERKDPILRYEAAFRHKVVGTSDSVPDGFLLDVENESASMTALVDDPALFAALGLDDCKLLFNQAVDVSKSSCGAPSFRNASCVEKDLYKIAQGADEMFPAAGTDDRCVTRPTSIDPTLPYKLLSRQVP